MASSNELEHKNLYKHYVPSGIAATVVAILFLILTVAHVWKVLTTKRWFALTIIAGGLFEFIGLAARAYSSRHLSDKGPFIIQVLLILLAPIIFSATIYMFLSRLINASKHPQLSLIRVRLLTVTFVGGDIFCFLVQAAGGGTIVNATTPAKIKSGQNLVLGGIALQVILFCFFAVTAAVFHVRISKRRFDRILTPGLHLNAMLFSLYLCSALITVRNIYRLIEYAGGETSYLQTHDWPTYGLDVGLMAVLMIVTLMWYFADTKGEHYNDTGAYTLRPVYPIPHVRG
ncbi:RTA1 like protein-domain-containing protein [Penicillium verhagenii]|uniref:RTA1 like protein-domain-containing protein n=1 Tax=Penicillium verhagenii TaxID=1562060 RepID=UPI0025454804|nr:RTA1 like protein-domain-containing protein [Penicillium verhagenii]KAJ5931023.1 RTA1 like protein-domain-containing protein [Penicillium verhagenii]